MSSGNNSLKECMMTPWVKRMLLCQKNYKHRKTVYSYYFAACSFNALSHLSHSALQQAGRNPTNATLNKYWTQRTSKLNFDDFCEILKNEKRTEETELMRAFKKMDVNSDGYISHSELEKALTTVSSPFGSIVNFEWIKWCCTISQLLPQQQETHYSCITDVDCLNKQIKITDRLMLKHRWNMFCSGVFTAKENVFNLLERRENDHWRGECYFLIGWHQQRWKTGLFRSKFRFRSMKWLLLYIPQLSGYLIFPSLLKKVYFKYICPIFVCQVFKHFIWLISLR